jgi:hypothetical protein
MALVLMVGLAVSTVLTLILLPTTVSLGEDFFPAIFRGLRRVTGRLRWRTAAPATESVDHGRP